MRSIKELYQIVLDNFDLMIKAESGICMVIVRCWYYDLITSDEKFALLKHFKKQRPTWYKNVKFYYHNSYVNRMFWWKYGEEGNEQRKLFLKHLINKQG